MVSSRGGWDRIKQAKGPPGGDAEIAAGARALRDALELSEIRKSLGITQSELAGRLGKSQGNVSELERRDDVYLSSLREYIEALGGALEVSAVFDGERLPIAMGAAIPDPAVVPEHVRSAGAAVADR